MATNIQASQTSGLIISPDQSGVLTLQSGSNTATMPAATGTVMVSGNMPAFAYYASSGTSVANQTNTKLLYATLIFDTANAVSSSTFTPKVAGYYQINANIRISGTTITATNNLVRIYKNGSVYATAGAPSAGSAGYVYPMVSSIVYLNGSTDYVEFYVQGVGGTSLFLTYGSNGTYMSGILVRTA